MTPFGPRTRKPKTSPGCLIRLLGADSLFYSVPVVRRINTEESSRSRRGGISRRLAWPAFFAGTVAASALLLLWNGFLGGLEGFAARWWVPEGRLTEAHETRSGNERFDHSSYQRVLDQFVDEAGLVDYDRLRADQDDLDRYLDALAKADLEALGRDALLALMINAYNAFTLRLIRDQPADLASIRDIPEERRWDSRRFLLGGERVSLTELEHDRLRGEFREPRIHFAISCASLGCPKLQRFAFQGHRLEEQLETAAADSHRTPSGYAFKNSTVKLSRVYLWFARDFEEVAGGILPFAARYDSKIQDALKRGQEIRIEWLPWDWSLNRQR